MIMSKEMERLKSKMELYKGLINLYDALNFINKSKNYDKILEHYQNELTEVYKRFQELKEVEINERANNNILQKR